MMPYQISCLWPRAESSRSTLVMATMLLCCVILRSLNQQRKGSMCRVYRKYPVWANYISHSFVRARNGYLRSGCTSKTGTMKTRHISIMFDLGLVGRSRRETGRSVLSTCVTLRQVEETLTLVVSFTFCTFHAKATTFPPLGFGGGHRRTPQTGPPTACGCFA